jgi:hypothetical protein
MARVVCSGDWVVLGDLLTDSEADAAAWHQEIDRLRDPSHWPTPTLERLREMGERTGLAVDVERTVPLDLDY